jgi:hypothetical protein
MMIELNILSLFGESAMSDVLLSYEGHTVCGRSTEVSISPLVPSPKHDLRVQVVSTDRNIRVIF